MVSGGWEQSSLIFNTAGFHTRSAIPKGQRSNVGGAETCLLRDLTPESLLAVTTLSKHYSGIGQGAEFQTRQRESRVQ